MRSRNVKILRARQTETRLCSGAGLDAELVTELTLPFCLVLIHKTRKQYQELYAFRFAKLVPVTSAAESNTENTSSDSRALSSKATEKTEVFVSVSDENSAAETAPPRTVKRRTPSRVSSAEKPKNVTSRKKLSGSSRAASHDPGSLVANTATGSTQTIHEIVAPDNADGEDAQKLTAFDTNTQNTAVTDGSLKVEANPDANPSEENDLPTQGEPVLEAEPEREAVAAPQRREVPTLSVVRARERGLAATQNEVVLHVDSLVKLYGTVQAASNVSFDVHAGSFTGVVGPNGAGKTTVLSMVSGLNRPTAGSVTVNGIDVWSDAPAAKRVIGSLPDRLRLFDRLTGAQLLYYFGILQGLTEQVVAERSAELAVAFGLESALHRTVSDYSAGMQKKIGLACAMIHAPEILVLDEPFETIDPVSAATVTDILEQYVAGGGSVVMSSHSLELIQRVCDHVVVIAHGSIVASGSVDSVRDGMSLEERFRALTRANETGKGLEWLRTSGSSD